MKNRQVDWSKIAEPQEDGYDTEVVLEFAEKAGYRRDLPNPEASVFDGAIAISHDNSLLGYEGCVYAPHDHPNLKKAEEIIRAWPVAYRQCKALVQSICFYSLPRFGDDKIIGSICGPGQAGFGSIIVTVNHHMGLAEGIVHEMAHHKLRAIGIDMEASKGLLRNSPDERYPSPIRYDCLRPMMAVVHAQYSYTYIAQLDLFALRNQSEPSRDVAIRELSLAVILPKLEFGIDVIEQNARTDDNGETFLAGFMDWCKRVIAEAKEDLEKNRVIARPFIHPIENNQHSNT